MGNTPATPTSLRLSNGDHSYQVRIGRSAFVYFKGKEVKTQDAHTMESWEVSYKVDNKSTFRIGLCKIKPDVIPIRECLLFVRMEDDTYQESPDDILEVFNCTSDHEGRNLFFRFPDRILENSFTSSTTNALGEFTTTWFYFYGRGKRLCLLVYEWKKKTKGDEVPYTGTVAHYYTNTENGQDIGLSIILKRIRALGGNVAGFDYAVDGPEQHPVAALLYMFNEVRRTKTWKPTSCPHCANNIIKKQRAGIWQSESEDSDMIDNNVPFALLHGLRQNAKGGGGGGGGGLLANDGRFKGDNNGNLNINKFIVALRGK